MPEEYSLLQNLNKNFCCGVIGRPGSGKTSLVTSFFTSTKIFKRVFHRIIVFMPAHSLSSMSEKTCPWYDLSHEQLFGELTPETMNRAWQIIEATRNEERGRGQTLVVFDDVQSSYKDVERRMLQWSANRRHYHLSLFVIGQSYKKLPRAFRQSMSDLFAFRLSRTDLKDIEEELVQIDKPEWEAIKRADRNYDRRNAFLYIHITGQRFYIQYNEVIVRSDSTS
jgi:hypothetical protein